MTAASTELQTGSSDRNAAVLAGFLGWTFDAFDWFIVTLCQVHIAASLKVDPGAIVWCLTLTLMARPVGAFIFGLLADRYGRRRPMMINLVFYSTLSILSGLAHTYQTFLICRILFGIGMGGEWGVGASLAMEKVPPRIRGLLSGLLQEGYAFGGLLAAGAFFLVHPRMGSDDWRPLFWIGGLPAVLAFFIRFRVRESAVWQKARKDSWSNLGTALVSHWRLFLGLMLLMLMMNLSSHGTQDLFPNLLRIKFNLDPVHSLGKVSMVSAVAFIGAIIGGVVVGHLSDRLGRRRAMVGSFILATLLVPLWAYAPNLILLMTGAFLLQFMVQGAWGVIPAHITELSPDSVRGVLPGFAYQCGSALSSVGLMMEHWLSLRFGLTHAMAISAGVILPVAAIVVGLGPESRGIVFGNKE
jgi:SHS family lactate transporter-like MFS transporter